jgi:hypothetical protein
MLDGIWVGFGRGLGSIGDSGMESNEGLSGPWLVGRGCLTMNAS